MNYLFNKQLSTRDSFLFVFFCCLLYALPIILADVYYRDDTERVLNPAAGWSMLGRPGADLLMRFLTFNFVGITDTSPFTLLLGILFISIVLLYAVRTTEKTLTIGSISPYILLFISPFFLQNISYKYDSFPMIVGLGLSIAAFFYPRHLGIKSYLVPTLLLFVTLTLYQPCANIFIGLYGVNMMLGFKKTEQSPLKESLLTAAILATAYISYYIIINRVFGLTGGRGDIIPFNEAWAFLTRDFNQLYRFIWFLITPALKVLILLSLICVIYAFILRISEFLRGKKFGGETFLSLLIILISPVILYIALLGPLFLLKEGVTDVRVLSGFSAIIFALSYSLHMLLMKVKPNLSILIVIPVLYFLSVSFQYGNAIKSQRDYENRIVSWLSYDLMSIQATNHGTIFINNYPNASPITQNIINHQSLIDLMYAPAYSWISRRLVASTGLKNVDLSWGDNYTGMLNNVCSNHTPPIKENIFYAIYPDGDNTVVWLKNKFKTMCHST
ncbi:glucosyltransferase domain-containing protein [Yersinia ruckeri]|uniref:glucosyltransferase domain-containing protein n=1 Tax=Yersinia ruckeri TaxID=29486 RepID=UPI002238D256|nr:glucosyltransferase domain-containing protein [Yersinia ruckeri]MCW6542893.1 glucosyltransferase domain-containing protein [Yersinia ruckeri]MCW6591525.1 glucosyltransferase domain-containing protein [Yersinia ruckeri]UZX90773.1 glucosyltransferase domain-containing protein [Yersinia ruckeri]